MLCSPNLEKHPYRPIYITRLGDPERYQTIYNRQEGSAAAPTAGLHFTPELLFALKDKGVHLAYCILHIGLDTFQPVHVEQVEDHHIHTERAALSAADARIINDAKLAGGRIIAVGTTSARTLETAAILSAGGEPSRAMELGDLCPWRPVIAFERDTDLFIYPGYHWRAVDALITNFHLPKSTLLMMISAFAGRETCSQRLRNRQTTSLSLLLVRRCHVHFLTTFPSKLHPPVILLFSRFSPQNRIKCAHICVPILQTFVLPWSRKCDIAPHFRMGGRRRDT